MRLEWHLMLLVLALWANPPAKAESASVLLERGIYNEETAGNLDEAIKIYKQIVDEAKTNRPAVAQAMLRLGMCQLKKGQTSDALSAFNTLIAQYADQKDLVAKARKQIQAARANTSGAELAKIVKEAVTTISKCAEGDPKIAPALESLQGLNETAVVKALAGYLDSDQPTVRRSAIYILWNGRFDRIEPAVPGLTKLCSHPEEFTRGMAALALGAKKVAPSYETLCDMATKDKSGYARRCAAIALGWLGRADAKEVLERVLKDSDAMVRANAEAAIKLLGASKPRVLRTTPAAFTDDVDPSLDKITATFDQEMMDRSWSWMRWSEETYPKMSGESSYDAKKTTCTLPVKLEPGKVYWVGINSPNDTFFQTPDQIPAIPYVILFATKSADGKPTPIPADLAAKAKAINDRAASPASPASRESRAPTQADKRGAERLAVKAWALWRQQNFAEAEPLFQQAVEKDPTNANTWNGLGWAQFNQGEVLNAQASLEKAVAINPKHTGALNGLGFLAKNAGHTEKAIEYWEKAVNSDPGAPAPLSGLATTYMEQKQYNKATKYYQMWLKAEPNSADAKAGLEKVKAATKGGH